VLVLTFHHVEPLPTDPDKQAVYHSRKGITVTPEGLRCIIRTLRFWGYQTVSLKDVMMAGGPEHLPVNTVLLTFDDGYVNNLTYGLPVLTEERCPAVIFVLAGRPGGTNDWDQGDLPETQRDRLLTEDQLKTLAESPWITYGSHGLYHRPMDRIEASALAEEIHQSYEILSARYPEAFLPVMAYPWGAHDASVVAAMAQSPYALGFTVKKALWQNRQQPYQIPRYSVYFKDSNPLLLSAKLWRWRLGL